MMNPRNKGMRAALALCAAFAIGLPVTVQAGDTAADEGPRSTSAHVGHAVGATAREVGQGVARVGRDVGHGAAEIGRDIGHAAKEAAVTVGRGAAEVGRDIGHVARDGSKALVGGLKGE